MDELIENLKEIGLNSYEAKVYLALLKKYPATGYDVSKRADIPQSRASALVVQLKPDVDKTKPASGGIRQAG